MTSTPASRTRHYLEAIAGGFVFAASVLYFAASYVGRYGIVAPATSGVLAPVAINVALLAGFSLHHSVFARAGAKALMARFVPADMERSVYVWVASGLFALVAALWQPVPGVLWRIDPPIAWLLRAVQIAGLVIAVDAGRRVDILALAGVSQTLRRRPPPVTAPTESGPYRVVRHPLHLALLLLVWPMPLMTGTRFVFAAAATLYLLIAIPLEERDLHRIFGYAYAKYAAKVRYRLVPWIY